MDSVPTAERPSSSRRRRTVLSTGLLLIAVVLFVRFFASFPIEGTSLGIDWRKLWLAFEGGAIRYEGTALRNPPWSVLPLVPLGLLSFRVSWAVLALATLACLILSVPAYAKPWLRWIGILLLVTSFPALRQIADGNLELLVIGGLLFLHRGFQTKNPWLLAGGCLIATAKPQETWLLMVAVGYYVLRTWKPRRWLISAFSVSLVVAPLATLLGREWLQQVVSIPQRGGIMDISLSAAVDRLTMPPLVSVTLSGIVLICTAYLVQIRCCRLSRPMLGMLAAASLLLAPYSAGNSMLTILAIGILPLLEAKTKTALAMITFADLPYLARILAWDIYPWQATYWTIVLLGMWLSLAVWVYRRASWPVEGSTPTAEEGFSSH